MNGARHQPAPSYRDLLSTAYALGHADGRLAAELEPLETPGAASAAGAATPERD